MRSRRKTVPPVLRATGNIAWFPLEVLLLACTAVLVVVYLTTFFLLRKDTI